MTLMGKLCIAQAARHLQSDSSICHPRISKLIHVTPGVACKAALSTSQAVGQSLRTLAGPPWRLWSCQGSTSDCCKALPSARRLLCRRRCIPCISRRRRCCRRRHQHVLRFSYCLVQPLICGATLASAEVGPAGICRQLLVQQSVGHARSVCPYRPSRICGEGACRGVEVSGMQPASPPSAAAQTTRLRTALGTQPSTTTPRHFAAPPNGRPRHASAPLQPLQAAHSLPGPQTA